MAKSFLGSLIKGSIKLAKIAAREAAKAQRDSERLRLKAEKDRIKAQLKIDKEKERLRKIEEKKANKNNITMIK